MKSILFKIFVFLIISFNAFSVSSNSRPRIIWASSPVGPNETVMIQAGDFSNTATIQLARMKDSKPGNPEQKNILSINDWIEVEILQRSSGNLKCVVPATWEPGIYACRILDGKTSSDTIFLNAPKVWWSQGENGESSSPGGWLRIVGNCLKIKSNEIRSHQCMVSLQNSQGKSFPLFIEQVDLFDIQVHIPAQVASGTYELWVHNGFGGKSGWNHGGNVQITDAIVPDLKVFDVKVFGIESALQRARENNGGIVYFPSGEYQIKNAIEIPENTVIRGDGIDKTIVYWNDLNEIPVALLHGKSFSIENLSLYCQNMYKNVIKVECGYFKMDSVRIRANPIFLLGRTEGESEFRGRKLNGKIVDIDACIHLDKVDHFEVSNCDILAGSYGIRLMNSSNGLVRDTRVQYGRNGFGCEAISRVIFENCTFEGMDLGATGNYFATYFGNSSEYLYLKGNNFANAYGLDQEFFTFDAIGGAYMGKIAKVNGHNLILAADPVFMRYNNNATDWRKAVVCILDGKGCGQYRRIKSHSGREWEMDKPWLIDPDTSSVISIIPFRGHTLIVNNTFKDGGAVQFYGTSIENVVYNNRATRMTGFFALGQESRGWGWQPSWYNQFLNNEITDGHNYRHQQTQIGVMGTVSSSHVGNYNGPLSKCIVIRNNKFQSNGLIRISGQSEDVLVEKNAMKNSTNGIIVEMKRLMELNTDLQFHVDHSVGSESKEKTYGILLRHNQFERVDNHYIGEAISGVKICKY